MPEKKFDLNKALQAAKVFYAVPSSYPWSNVNRTLTGFNYDADEIKDELSWIGSGARARKEEQEKRDNLPWHSKLGYQLMTVPQDTSLPLYSQSAADRLMVGDYAGAEAIQKPLNTIGAIATGAGLLGAMGGAGLFSAAATYGWPAALTAEAVSTGTGIAGYHGFNKLGQRIDNKYGTNIAPYLSFFGSLGTGIAGYNAGLRTAAGLARSAVNNGIRGYSDFKPALTDMMIKYTKPMKLGNVSFNPSESHIKIFNNRGSESGMSTYFKTAKYAGNTGSYNGRTVPAWQLPRGERMQKTNTVLELPEQAFSSNPYFKHNLTLIPNKKSLKFVDDVTKGAYLARRESLKPQPELIDFTEMYHNAPLEFIGSGAESQVYSIPGVNNVLKFNYGDMVTPIEPINDIGHTFKSSVYDSLDELIEDSSRMLADANRYWYAEPQYLVGYRKTFGDKYLPVFSQKKMFGQVEQFPKKYSMWQQQDYTIPDFMGDAPIYKNEIFSENNLRKPVDAHEGNFMYDENGILRAIDIHKQGGKIK